MILTNCFRSFCPCPTHSPREAELKGRSVNPSPEEAFSQLRWWKKVLIIALTFFVRVCTLGTKTEQARHFFTKFLSGPERNAVQSDSSQGISPVVTLTAMTHPKAEVVPTPTSTLSAEITRKAKAPPAVPPIPAPLPTDLALSTPSVDSGMATGAKTTPATAAVMPGVVLDLSPDVEPTGLNAPTAVVAPILIESTGTTMHAVGIAVAELAPAVIVPTTEASPPVQTTKVLPHALGPAAAAAAAVAATAVPSTFVPVTAVAASGATEIAQATPLIADDSAVEWYITPSNYDELQKNIIIYYGGQDKIPSYIRLDPQNRKMKLCVLHSALPKESREGITPYPRDSYQTHFGVSCSIMSRGTDVTKKIEAEKELNLAEYPDVALEKAVKPVLSREVVQKITNALVSFFTSGAHLPAIEIVRKEGEELMIKLHPEGEIVPMSTYFSSIDPSYPLPLNESDGFAAYQAKVKQIIAKGDQIISPKDAVLLDKLGDCALHNYINFCFAKMNQLMRSGTVEEADPDKIMTHMFHIILLKYRLHRFVKLDFAAPQEFLRRDIAVPPKYINALVTAYKVGKIVCNPSFWSTTRKSECVMGKPGLNATFRIKPLPFRTSQGVLIYGRGGKEYEEEILFPPTVFKIIHVMQRICTSYHLRGTVHRVSTEGVVFYLEEVAGANLEEALPIL